ncbi:MAG: sigma-54 dependent transcriptional regulator [candidate division KSB1 bacterium]|nr:sigma-54 dependent transcriptional regulator [candidate division KSB1 bacterium]MDZ7368866.1 sigma-54 dependent transcriptional regulator [candidate division KSB1 bacterium]MDZ7407155.1 sigma-54 dependent transcriptional regulator [candidate division KSB1 bacterium]
MQPTSEKYTLLIIDDNPHFVEDLRALTGEEFLLITAGSGEEGLRKFSECSVDLVLLDLKLGRGIDGLETLRRLKRIDPDVPVIMVTEYASLETAHQAGRLGAAHYCSKAPSLKELRMLIAQHVQNLPWRRAYRDQLLRQHPRFIGDSPVVRKLFAEIETLAPTDCTVLITGETGTGKELIAHEIHHRSHRAHRPLLAINCSNLPSNLFESEFFGHERGAFTGAVRQYKGKFEEADGSTLFLDEIADLPLESQPKILRAIEYGTFRRLGGQRDQQADVRLLAATNKNLEKEVAAGRFREDLFYRINRVQLHVPSLRERREDIPLLAKYYLEYFSMTLHKPIPEISEDLVKAWCEYDWPGNIRALSGEMEKLVLYSTDGKIDRSRLRIFTAGNNDPCEFFMPLFDLPYEQAKEKLLAQFQQDYFREHLTRSDGNMTRVAEATGVNRTTIYRILGNAQAD